jgi:ATP-binding cassette, subfamily B, multidrug efflux pump
MSTGQPTGKPAKFWPSARRLLGLLAPHRFRTASMVAFALASVLLAALGPLILGQATDIIFSGVVGKQLPSGTTVAQAIDAANASHNPHFAALLAHIRFVPGAGIDFTVLEGILVILAVVYLLSNLFLWAQMYVLNNLVQAVVLGLRAKVEDKIHRMPLQFFDRQPRGDLLSRVTNDIGNISQSLQQTLSQLLNSLITVIAVAAMMFAISPLLACVALVTTPLTMYVSKRIAKRSQGHFIAQWTHTGELNSRIEEAFSGHELIRVFGRQREVAVGFDTKNGQLYSASLAAQFVSGTILPAVMFIGNLNYVLVAVIGGLWVATGAVSLGAVQAFIQYSRQFTGPLTQIASMAGSMQSGAASAQRVFDLLDAPEQAAEPLASARPTAVSGRVEFERVSFRYQPDRPLLEDISLVAAPGHTIAIVGPTGAGKTTLVNLLLRFYEVDSGRITLDGLDIKTMRQNELRAHIGMVLQDTWLFKGTIRENIRYGRPEASDEDVITAARATYVDRFVRNLPDGYETVVDDENNNLSSGQRQLITMARAFLTNPALLVLDEATSSVDTRTEALVQHAMVALRSNRTSFVIAHRLSTVRDANLILVMRGGRIVEQGTHDELLALEGDYYELYEAQFAGPTDDETLRAAGRLPMIDRAAGAAAVARRA